MVTSLRRARVSNFAEQLRTDMLVLADQMETVADRDELVSLVGPRMADRPRQLLQLVGRRGATRLGPPVVRIAQLGWNSLVPAHRSTTPEEVHRVAAHVAKHLRSVVEDPNLRGTTWRWPLRPEIMM